MSHVISDRTPPQQPEFTGKRSPGTDAVVEDALEICASEKQSEREVGDDSRQELRAA